MKVEKALDHKCPACGAPLEYKPKLKKWKCDYCDSEFSLNDLKKHNNASSEKNNIGTEEVKNLDCYLCRNCGAEIIADSLTSATFCVYCGNTAILKNKLTGKFAPSKIIPFKTTKEDAINKFKGLSKGRPLMPKSFNDTNNIEKIRGIYIPFWLFDISVGGRLEALASRVTSWTSGNRQYTKTDRYKLIRDGNMKYNYVPIDGSTHFDNAIMNSIEPFDYKEMVDYNHAYLSGFLAEKYDEESDKVLPIARNRALVSTRNEMLSNMGSYTTKSVVNDTITSKEESSSYALLPVWMVNVKYKDKMYIFAMNGQTGEFIGNIPIDKGKAVKMSIIMFLGIFFGIIIISLIYHFITGGIL